MHEPVHRVFPVARVFAMPPHDEHILRRMEAIGTLPYKQFLGYEKGEDGLPRIVEKEAAIVRRISRQYLQGKTFSTIAR